MSVRLMAAIFESETLGPTERLILLALADHADDSGRCYPSISRLAQRTGLSERAVRNNVRAMEKTGYITVHIGIGPSGKNVYFVRSTPAADAPRQEMPPAAYAPPPRQEIPVTPAADAPEPSRTTIKPSNGREKDLFGENEGVDAPQQESVDVHFDRFWKAYPKKVGKPAALKNFRKAVKDGENPERIIEAAGRYARTETVQRGYAKHPQGWLTDQRWNDPELWAQEIDPEIAALRARYASITENARSATAGAR